jgi:LmbE family N-acetylglucosaminyl deacetylase
MFSKIKFKLKKIFSLIYAWLISDYNYFSREFIPLLNVKDLNTFLSSFPFRSRYKVKLLSSPKDSRVLVIAPHPDDEIFGCGGVLLKMLDRGCSVSIVYVTAGQVKNKSRIKKEAVSIAKNINCNVFFLDNNPSQISLSSSKDIQNLINKLDPNYIFTPFFLDDNDDHKRVNEMLLSLKIFKSDITIWAYQVYSMMPLNSVVNITDVIEKKMELSKQYKHVSGDRDWPHYIKGLNAVMSRFIPGKESLYGESYFIANLNDYIELTNKYFLQSRSNCYSVKEYIE